MLDLFQYPDKQPAKLRALLLAYIPKIDRKISAHFKPF